MPKASKIIVVAMQYDYGVKERGSSYEHMNVFKPLCDIYGADNIDLFDFYDKFKLIGKEKMNDELTSLLKSNTYDAAIFCLFTDEFSNETLDSYRKYTKTIVYFFDDPWRQSYVREKIKHFDFFTTPDYYMHKIYLADGIKNVIYSPFGYNSNFYKNLNAAKDIDVSFIGGYSAYRAWVVDLLIKNGIKVEVFGRGWGNQTKFLSYEEVVGIINRSKINLNIINGISFDIGYLIKALLSPRAMKQILLNRKTKEQVKGRHYEINGCGGFQLSYFIPGLNPVYEIDKEIAVYEDARNLPDLIKFFLKNESLREEIATNGYNRSVSEHSAQKYLENVIETAIGNR